MGMQDRTKDQSQATMGMERQDLLDQVVVGELVIQAKIPQGTGKIQRPGATNLAAPGKRQLGLMRSQIQVSTAGAQPSLHE
jgi:hypothetical protein